MTGNGFYLRDYLFFEKIKLGVIAIALKVSIDIQ